MNFHAKAYFNESHQSFNVFSAISKASFCYLPWTSKLKKHHEYYNLACKKNGLNNQEACIQNTYLFLLCFVGLLSSGVFTYTSPP